MNLLLILALWAALADGDAAKGKVLFQSCAGCHNTASDDRKMGPSLRTLFGKVTLRNGKHVDDANVREIVVEGTSRHIKGEVGSPELDSELAELALSHTGRQP